MKNLASRCVFVMIMVSPLLGFSQILLHGPEEERIQQLADQFTSDSPQAEKVIKFIYVDTNLKSNRYYFGLISRKEQLLAHPPSYYFYDAHHQPVVVYTGFEKSITFWQPYVDEIKELADKFLLQDQVSVKQHYEVWFVKFRNGKEVVLKKHLSPRRMKEIPAWIENPYAK